MSDPSQALPVDADVDLHVPQHATELQRGRWTLLAAIAAGGALGSLARYGVESAFPTATGGFPWATFGVNVTGCLLIGVLMVLVGRARQRLARPFLGVGVLGGYTTFSFHVLEAHHLIDEQAVGTALVYLTATAVAALLAVYAGMGATRTLLKPRAYGRAR